MPTPTKRGPYRKKGSPELGPATYIRLPAELHEFIEKNGGGISFAESCRRALAEWALAKCMKPSGGGRVRP